MKKRELYVSHIILMEMPEKVSVIVFFLNICK